MRLWTFGGKQHGRSDTVLPRTYTPELKAGGSGGSVAMGIDGRPPQPAWAVGESASKGVTQRERVAFLGREIAWHIKVPKDLWFIGTKTFGLFIEKWMGSGQERGETPRRFFRYLCP